MDNIIQFPKKEISEYDAVKKIFGTEKFISFYYDDDGGLCYLWGNNVTLMEMTYIQKILDVFGMDELKANVKWGNND